MATAVIEAMEAIHSRSPSAARGFGGCAPRPNSIERRHANARGSPPPRNTLASSGPTSGQRHNWPTSPARSGHRRAARADPPMPPAPVGDPDLATKSSRWTDRPPPPVSSFRYLDWADEAVAAPGDIYNEPVAVAPITQPATQGGHMDRKFGRFDKCVGPKLPAIAIPHLQRGALTLPRTRVRSSTSTVAVMPATRTIPGGTSSTWMRTGMR